MRWSFIFFLIIFTKLSAQDNFPFQVSLKPEKIPGLPGLHSYAFGSHDGKWLIIGGRLDGIHARQPFNAFPAKYNNRFMYVVDPQTKQSWSVSTDALATSLREQLQSTNMNFYQDGDSLYIIGGYAFSNSKGDHITFPRLSVLYVPGIVNGILQQLDIRPYFLQIEDERFAVTGGRLGKMENKFYLVGGQKFDGRYNPMGHPTFVQQYTDQIRSFRIHQEGDRLEVVDYNAVTDAVHLHRRDYNLVPERRPNGDKVYLLSSGVFQVLEDLPFLYPVEISSSKYVPRTDFNQYLSHYHSAYASIYDSVSEQMHTLFFGGMSQYHYEQGVLVRDDQVPFVKTLSRLTRFKDGTYKEYAMDTEMPGYLGAGAEFFMHADWRQSDHEILTIKDWRQDSLLIGYVFGGIVSNVDNAFSTNQTNESSASATVYAVWLRRRIHSGNSEINGHNPYAISLYPNPVGKELKFQFHLEQPVQVHYYLSDSNGHMLLKGYITDTHSGLNTVRLNLDPIKLGWMQLNVVFDQKYFVTQNVVLNKTHR